MADHLSRLEISNKDQGEINREFPNEKILSITFLTLISSIFEIPLFADYGNFLVGDLSIEEKILIEIKH